MTQLTETLAERSEQLAALEREVGDLHEETASGLSAGRFLGEQLTAEFRDDGTFRLGETGGRRAIEGRYTEKAGQLTLSEASGDLGTAVFPITCRIEGTDRGFRFAEGEGLCSELAGVALDRITP